MKERLPERKIIQPELRVLCGPMFSGKSGELILELTRAPHSRYEVMAFKPKTDNRRGRNTINSQDGAKYPATSVKEPYQILDLVTPNIHIVGIDEAQFFNEGIVDVCLELVRRGKKVIVAGLDKNFRGEPFGPMAILKQEADHVDSFHSFCGICGEPASFTQRIINGEPANYNEPVVVVGAEELYDARCRKHHEVPGKPPRSLSSEPLSDEAFKKISRMARRWAEKAVEDFSSTGDLGQLSGSLVEAYRRITKVGRLHPFGFSTFITDRASDKDNKLIIREAKKARIKPAKNCRGLHPEATSCLVQIIERSLSSS